MARRSAAKEAARRPAGTRRPPPAGDDDQAAMETQALYRAADHCFRAFRHCVTHRSTLHDLEDLMCLVDSAEVCKATAGVLARDGDYAQELLDLCAQQLQDVAGTCSEYPDDEVLSACADTLRETRQALTGRLMAP